jgi:hypothetical protein
LATPIRDVSNLSQRICLGEVTRDTPSGNFVGYNHEAIYSSLLILEIAGDVYFFPGFKAALDHILGIHEDHSPPTENATIPVVLAINGGIKLIMASNRHQQKFFRPLQ